MYDQKLTFIWDSTIFINRKLDTDYIYFIVYTYVKITNYFIRTGCCIVKVFFRMRIIIKK